MTTHQQVITLKYWGYKNRDIVEFLGVSPGVVAVSWWKERNRDKVNRYSREGYRRHKEKYLATTKEKRAKFKAEYPTAYREMLFKHKCSRAGIKYERCR